VQKKKRKATACSACQYHKNCDEEHKIEGHGRIVYVFVNLRGGLKDG
jgi:hypothetical protein